MLKLQNISAGYGKNDVLKNITLQVNPGEIVTIIGANGAGKTTTLKTIAGLLKPRQGEVLFNGTSILALRSDLIVRHGISLCPEGRKIFSDLTVEENLKMGAFTSNNKLEIQQTLETNLALFPILRERFRQKGGTLSGGEQQMLAIARSLMSRPKLLLLDEPSLGLAPKMVEKISSIIQNINRAGTSILLVEQNANLALQISHRGHVLETGNIIFSDSSTSLLKNEKIKSAYLGT